MIMDMYQMPLQSDDCIGHGRVIVGRVDQSKKTPAASRRPHEAFAEYFQVYRCEGMAVVITLE